MELGAFSISLAVKNLQASKDFYQKLGFSVFHGDESQKWLILKNGESTIGLFEGMFDKNIITFNPGWNQSAEKVSQFTDVRDIQKSLEQKGVTLIEKADTTTKGPAHISLVDPDGNPVLIDQHVE